MAAAPPHLPPPTHPRAQVPAVFSGLLSYKNGMKGAIATQVAQVVFSNFTVADNGGGPSAHAVNGKDHGGGVEMTWVVDGRNRWVAVCPGTCT
jgi:hypothetical protein